LGTSSKGIIILLHAVHVICTKFCTLGRLSDVITCFKFCVDRLRGFGSVRGRNLPFSIDLAGRH